jgi:hypothetical protein
MTISLDMAAILSVISMLVSLTILWRFMGERKEKNMLEGEKARIMEELQATAKKHEEKIAAIETGNHELAVSVGEVKAKVEMILDILQNKYKKECDS